MSYDFDIDNVVECVKNIVDCHRCMFCDRLEGSRWRYSCGHIGCGVCVETASSCILCLSPLDMASPEPIQDLVLTKRVGHASNLLSTCQNMLKVDVYTRHRTSDQQKVEKEVFPECIQAPVKYSNKRKILNMSLKKDKENRKKSLLPGESISPVKPMKQNQSFSYIQNWLDKIDDAPEKSSRKPLLALNVNSNCRKLHAKSSPLKRRVDIIMDKVKESETHLNKKKWSHKDEKDESGIVMDDPIYIDDSQDDIKACNEGTYLMNKPNHSSTAVDKDKQAWLAVLEAEKSENAAENTPVARLECSEVIQYTNDIEKSVTQAKSTLKSDTVSRVPFYKKSCLIDPNQSKSCFSEQNITPVQSKNIKPAQSKNVEIKIENSSFITTIEVKNVDTKKQQNYKQSIQVQTDISGIDQNGKTVESSQLINKKVNMESGTYIEVEKDSLDLFTAELKVSDQQLNPEIVQETKKQKLRKGSLTVISESDSSDTDDGFNKSETLLVIADVHRSSDQLDYGVFSELEQRELISRPRKRKHRGHTPNSSDSSDKENRDPNRAKRINMAKKDPKKDPIKRKNRKKLGVLN